MGAYLYGDLSPEEMREVRLHANQCSECREDLQSRSIAIASVSDRVPELTDLDRQKIAWFVEGAVCVDRREQPRFRFAPVFVAGMVVIAAGVAAGVYIASSLVKPQFRQAERDEKPAVHATVKIKEEPPQASTKADGKIALKKPADKDADSSTTRIANTIANAMQNALRSGVGVTRGHEQTHHRNVVPEETLEEVPVAGDARPADNPANEAQSDPTKLPKPSNPNDASTAPADNAHAESGHGE
jgi:hypothetical protein